MTFSTTRQLLGQIKTFHLELGSFYSDAAGRVKRAKVIALLRYMGEHERHLKRCLDRYEKLAHARVLERWFQFSPRIPRRTDFERVVMAPEMTIADVVQVTLGFDDRLMRFVGDLADQSDSIEVKALFVNLLEMEEQEKHKASRAALEMLEGV